MATAAPTTAVDAIAVAGSQVAHDLSALSLFFQADLIVKSVIIGLLLASVYCWAIIIDKVRKLKTLNEQADEFEERFWSGRSLEDLYDDIRQKNADPMTAIFVAAMREWRRSASKGSIEEESKRANLRARIERVMNITLNREMDTLEKNMIFLASTGSAAPFVGLFGTVWGIINSFSSIASSKNTSLVVVAPGIAEALFATAIGLVAAIPAVIAYNKLSTELARYSTRLESFSGEFSAIMSRQLDEGL